MLDKEACNYFFMHVYHLIKRKIVDLDLFDNKIENDRKNNCFM